MKKRIVQPRTKINGTVFIPASKSHAQRALASALLNPNKTILKGIGQSDDERAVMGVLESLGASIERHPESFEIYGLDFTQLRAKNIFIGESGLASRMLTPIMALAHTEITILGHGSILQRPMYFFEEILPQLNATISSNEGKLPISVCGPIKPSNITVDGSLSSQFITGLIFAFVGSPLTKSEVITIENPTSVPYINLSIQTLREFGIDVRFDGTKVHFNGPYTWKDTELQIEGDWSSAAFFIVAASLFGSLTFDNLNLNSAQADKAILDIVKSFGAEIKISPKQITVSKKELTCFHFDATNAPDLFPILAVLGAYGTATSSIKGVHRLTHKESNRAEAILTEFSKFGAKMHIENDTLYIEPQSSYSGATIDPHSDHRMVMAAAIFALGVKEETTLLNPEACAKSFPNFFDIYSELS